MSSDDNWLKPLEALGEEVRVVNFYSGIYSYLEWLGQPPFHFDAAVGAFDGTSTQLMAFGYTFEGRDLQKAIAECVKNSGAIGPIQNPWGVFSLHRAIMEDGITVVGVADFACKPGVMPYRAARVIYTDAGVYTVQDMSPAEEFPLWWPNQ